MTRGRFDATNPTSGAGWHPPVDLLTGYAAGAVDDVAAWSVETHLEACATCRAAVSAHVDGDRLARSRAVLLARIAIPAQGWLWRLACRAAVPDHLLRLLAATPSLRRSWLLSVIGVLSVATGEAVLANHLRHVGAGPGALAGYPGAETLAPFLLVGPVLVLAGVAAAFMPALDPSYSLAIAAPFSGLTLLLVRAVSALLAALVLVVGAAFFVPGPGWLPAAVLLPSLAVCACALAAVTVVGPLAAVVGAGALWVLPAVMVAVTHSPLVTVQARSQMLCAAVLVAAASVVFIRRDRLEQGWAS